MIKRIIDLLFPSYCYYCGKIGPSICKDCLEKVAMKPIFRKVKNDYFNYVFFGSNYKGQIRTLMHNFKFHRKSYMYEYFVLLSLNNKKIYGFLKEFDYITYVPMHKKKEDKRGYNQSKLLAQELGKIIKIEVINLLEKSKECKTQSTLNEKERKNNVENVFSLITNNNIVGKNIILVDDIFTTGATARECSKILKSNGANNICVFTIAKA